MKAKSKTKIVVAMSGGVDSSVSAALLKQAGFDVVGVMMKFWSDKNASHNLTDKKADNRCCSIESEKLARLVAKQIGIPFYVVNVEKEFKKKVVDYFLKEYKSGRTPNPCVVCNKEIKFGLLMQKALKMGADYVATGHYVRTTPCHSGLDPESRVRAQTLDSGFRQNDSGFSLLKGKDKNKDQSYFLWQLNQKQLSRVLFPVGNYTKPEVRKLAKKFDLPTAETPESQEVCFINNSTNDFLKKYLKIKPGKIVEKTLRHGSGQAGKVLGQHQGLWFYTIGQRKGIEVQQGPWYVVEKDYKKNNLIISKNQKDLLKKELILKDVNWLSGKDPKLPTKIKVKIRYKSKEAEAVIYKLKNKSYKLIFTKPQRAITPGQSAVFYRGKELLGGGVIDTN